MITNVQANEFKYNRPQYEANARRWTLQHATVVSIIEIPSFILFIRDYEPVFQLGWERNESVSRRRL
jgi:hypothetical protein